MSNMSEIVLKCSEAEQIDAIWLKRVQNYPRWFKMVENWSSGFQQVKNSKKRMIQMFQNS